MYFEIYDILSEFIYGAGAELTNYMELSLTLASTFAVGFVVAFPFIVIFRIGKAVLR